MQEGKILIIAWLLITPLSIWVTVAQGMPLCPSLAYLDLCTTQALMSEGIAALEKEQGDTPSLSLSDITVGNAELLLAQTISEITIPEPSERGEDLFWNLGISLDLLNLGSNADYSNPNNQEQSFVLGLGHIASLEAKLDFLTYLIELIIGELNPSELPESGSERGTLVLNLDNLSLSPGIILEGKSVLAIDPGLDFYLDRITVTVIAAGTVTSETELNPTGFTIEEERLGIRFNLGAISIGSSTTFGDQRVTEEVITMSAIVGEINLVSEATFATDLQVFKIGATIAGLAFSSTSISTPTGLGSQIFELEIEF